MKNKKVYTVLVSGASGVVGYGILKSLKQATERSILIGTTIYEDSVAQGFCDVFEKALPSKDPNYINWLVGIINKYQVDLMIPGIEVDVQIWAENLLKLHETGAKVLINNPSLISLCADKWLFYNELINNLSLFAIPTTIANNFENIKSEYGLPFLLKPRCSYGSKGIVRINTENDFLAYKSEIGEKLMVQPIIGSEDEEFSTSAFCDGKGAYFALCTLKRKLAKDGFTEKAEVFESSQIHEAILVLCKEFKPYGPTNFQFRIHKGGLKLLEINPRISSATSIRAAFGYNESVMSMEFYLENKNPVQPLIRKGRAVRYMEDCIFYENGTNI